eukprot:670805-Amphidinium_carterae.1
MGWKQGPQGRAATNGKYASVWRQCWQAQGTREIQVYKIKAHAQRPGPDAPPEALHHWIGNDRADFFARTSLEILRHQRPAYDEMARWEDRVKRLTTWAGYQGGLIARQEYQDTPSFPEQWHPPPLPTSTAT